jgi:Flp pilus assembly protein TadG
VELALMLPLLILMIMIVLEGSALVRTHQILNNAAREGARLSVIEESRGHTADIVTQVIAYAAQNGVTLTAGEVVINQSAWIPVAGAPAIYASQVTVTHSYTFNYLAVFAWLGVPSTYALQGAAEFRNYYGPP